MTIHEVAASPLLLITLDRLPAWLLPPWGCSWVSMPAINRLAARGVVFDRLVATSDVPVETLAAVAGLPNSTGPEPWPLLAAAQAAGLAPVVITDDEALVTTVAADPAGAEVIAVPVLPRDTVAENEAATNLGRLFAAAADRVSTGAHRFLWVHASSLGLIWDAPTEYREAYVDPDDPPPPDGTQLPDLVVDAATDPDFVVGVRHVMAGQLTLLDSCLARVLDALPDGGASWGILLAGVRGLGLGLHGRLGPGRLPPFGEIIHLPAIMIDPAGRMAAQRFGGLVTPADLGSTLLERTGRPIPAADDPRCGLSLEPLFRSWEWRPRDRVICQATAGTAVATPAWLLVTGGRNPIDVSEALSPPGLYCKPDDFFELSDVADRCPDVTAELLAVATLAASDPRGAWTHPLSQAASG